MTSKIDIFNFFSQSYQREAYKYTLSLSYQYIKYSAFKKGVFVWPLIYRDLHIMLIRQTTTLYKMTSKKDISNFLSQFSQREAYEYTLSFLYRYIKYSAF